MRKSQLAPPIVPVLLAAALVLFSASAASGAVQLAIGQKESLVDAMEPTVAVKADGNRVVVQVLSASYNCCHVADARLVVEEGRVEIRERNAGTICLSFLPCYFDVTYTISRLAPATYEVFLFDEESTLLAAETVEVGAIVDQPECTDEAVEKEKVVASATHDSIVVEHRAVRLQSCLIFAPEVEIDGASIRITARDASPVPCRSVCYYDLAVEIPGLRPGTYAVRYIGFDGQLALETDVAIAPPQVVVTQAAIPRTAEPPEERISVFVEGDDVIVEYVAIVQQCCLDLDAWAELRQDRDPGSLDVRTQDNGPPCDCIGSFIIRIEVLDLLPGTYRATCGLGEGASGDVTIGPAGPEEVFFLRGFVSIDDWEITISDAIQILGHLFLGAPPELPCHDAADANDDGKLDLTDAVYLLGYLFLGGPEPPPPFDWRPGLDPTEDELGCEEVPCDPRKLSYETQVGARWDFVEFCIPAGKEYQDDVSQIYPEVEFLPGSRGRIGCTDDEVLCIIEWPDVNRSKMCWLTGRTYIREIRGSHWE